MSVTDATLRLLAAKELGIVSGNETLGAGDDAKLDEYFDGVRAWLIEEGLCYWATDAVPEAVKIPLAQIVAQQAAEHFGRGQGAEAPYTLGDSGFRALERHCSKRSSKEPVPADYF